MTGVRGGCEIPWLATWVLIAFSRYGFLWFK